MFKPSVGLEYNFNKDLSFQTGLGKVISKEGNLDANTFEANLAMLELQNNSQTLELVINKLV